MLLKNPIQTPKTIPTKPTHLPPPKTTPKTPKQQQQKNPEPQNTTPKNKPQKNKANFFKHKRKQLGLGQKQIY